LKPSKAFAELVTRWKADKALGVSKDVINGLLDKDFLQFEQPEVLLMNGK